VGDDHGLRLLKFVSTDRQFNRMRSSMALVLGLPQTQPIPLRIRITAYG